MAAHRTSESKASLEKETTPNDEYRTHDAGSIAGDPAALEAALVEEERFGRTQRGLKSRHIQLIALGGAIGTGLFVGSGMLFSLRSAVGRGRRTRRSGSRC